MNTTVLTELINQYGYLAIALLIALENIFPPIPSEVILTFAGFLTLNSELHILGVIVASTIGAVLLMIKTRSGWSSMVPMIEASGK